MAASTSVFDICDGQLYVLLSDTVGASAGPSYGAAIDVPGIGALSGVDPQIVSASLKGNCRVIARQSYIDSVNFGVTFGKVATDVIQALNAGELWDSGVNHGVRVKAGVHLPYFKFVGTITGVDAGKTQLQFIAYKAQTTSQTQLDQSSDNFGQPKFEANAIGIDSGVGGATPPALEPTTLYDLIITDAA